MQRLTRELRVGSLPSFLMAQGYLSFGEPGRSCLVFVDITWSWFGGLISQSCLTLATPWTVAHQAPLSMGFSKKEYWLIFPSPGDLPNPGIEPVSSAWQANSLLVRHLGNLTLIALPHFIKSQHRHKTRLPIDSQPCSLVAGREEVGFIFSPMG